ncbi:hypothetical protein H632_c1224p1 [Helicosporidium sp. ATCC 50920]|nr:hypothetical protein H632_c1224p1 [Helicosporidium sp. ATCC 50920]|eukprot:KDD74561.1 hypothetical protein H632_c1224p1 [Helicosporidium sp. ATCC 50920]
MPIASPFSLQDRKSAWQDWIAKYRAALAAQGLSEESRMARQRAASPSIVPRNAELKRVSDEAEKGNAVPLNRYLEALLRPYDDPAPGDELSWRLPGPSSPRMGIECLSCAS